MLRLIALVTLLGFSSSTLAQQCDNGCPCGNTCISCQDTCRVGNGSARGSGGGEQDPTFLLVVTLGGAAVALAAVFGLVWLSMPSSQPTNKPTLPSDREAAAESAAWAKKQAAIDAARDRFERCVIDLAPIGATTRAELDANEAQLRRSFAEARDPSLWLDARGCP
jgi:hypothetical protein